MSEHRGYSNWDRRIRAGKHDSAMLPQPGESKAQARCRARTEVVEHLIAGDDADLQLLSAHIGAWRNHWRSVLIIQATPEKVTAVANLSVNRIMLRACRPMFMFLGFVLAMAFGPLLIGSSATFPVLGFFIVPIVMLPFLIWMRPTFYLLRSVVHATCPDCEYSLKELPDAIELPGDERTGPAVCPECGCPWPLIPPRPPN